MKPSISNLYEWLRSYCPNDIRAKVYSQLEKETFFRIYNRSYLLAVAFILYGITVLPTLQIHRPDLTLLDNLIPRILFNAFPLVALAELLKRSKISPAAKIEIFYIMLPVIILIASNIYVWQTAIQYDGNILGPVNAANSFVFTISIAGIYPPIKAMLRACLYFSIIFWLPYLVILKLYAHPSVFFLAWNDVISCVSLNIFLASTMVRRAAKDVIHSLEVRATSESFLGKHITKAIWDKADVLKSRNRRGIFLDTDIRDSTEIIQFLNLKKDDFVKDYKTLVLNLVSKHHGEVLNEAGDGHLSFFGPEENHDLVDLDGIPGIEAENEYAEKRLYQVYLNKSLLFLQELINGIDLLRDRYGLQVLNIGAGLSIETECFEIIETEEGNNKRYQISIGNDAPTIVNRLQKFSKIVRNRYFQKHSVIAMHPNLKMFKLPEYIVPLQCLGQIENFPEIQVVYIFALPNEQTETKAIIKAG